MMMTKKIMIIDGGPRKNFNTASMLQKFAEGAMSVGNDIEVKTVRLYGIDYKGCMSCMACKIKGKASNVCKFKDALTPILEEIAQADGLVLGSPIYFGDVTGQMRAFLERLAFPWLSYNDSQGYGSMEHCIKAALGEPEHIIAYNTYQVNDYNRFELGGFSEETKRQYRDEHWQNDLQKAYDAGRRMAEGIQ